jgi:superfamily I DNA and/or RNA helicase
LGQEHSKDFGMASAELMPSNLPADTHFQHLAHLIDLEAEAEKQEDLRAMQQHHSAGAEASGSSIVNLVIRDQDVGLGGSVVLTLGKRNQNLSLPWTRLGTGSPVLFSEESAGSAPGSGNGWRGTVSRVQKDTIQVSFAEYPEAGLLAQSERPTFRLDRSSDEISRRRQRGALDRARGATSGNRLASLRDVLLGQHSPAFLAPEEAPLLDSSLNLSQQEAVRFALSAQDIAILHGPPGTGKTTTLVEIIRQIVRKGQSVLAVAPSNIAVDNLLERLLVAGEQAIRLGNPARVLPELRTHTLDGLLENHPDMRLARKLTREAYALRDQAARFTRARPEPGARQAQRREAKQMLADARQIEDQLVDRLIRMAPVVCATTTGLDWHLLGGRIFDWCVLDEASQGTEPVAWIPLQYAQRLILAGDPFQLPPTILSAEAIAGRLQVSLMERLMSQLDPVISRRLDVQYRMHQHIMAFSSAEFYQNSLIASPMVREHLLQDLPGITVNAMTSTPLDYIDTAGASYDEAVEPEGESRYNTQEADLAVRKAQALLDAGLDPAALAVITPYSAQVRLLREQLKQVEIEIDSVDGFQGREKEAIIVSLVRSNPDGEIGFLEDIRRMNVALTRARRKLIVIGDSATITHHPFYHRMVSYFESVGAYHSVWEELNS